MQTVLATSVVYGMGIGILFALSNIYIHLYTDYVPFKDHMVARIPYGKPSQISLLCNLIHRLLKAGFGYGVCSEVRGCSE